MFNCPHCLTIENNKLIDQYCSFKESNYFNCNDCSYKRYQVRKNALAEEEKRFMIFHKAEKKKKK